MPGGHYAKPLSDPEEVALWEQICAQQGRTFVTSGRGRRAGIPFTYTVRSGEMFVSSRAKSITRATVLCAYRKVQSIQAAGGTVSGPKAIGVHGDAYLFSIFRALSVLKSPADGEKTADFLLDRPDFHAIMRVTHEEEATPMSRPKGSKNKKTLAAAKTEALESVESLDARIAAVQEAIASLSEEVKAKKAELKQLQKSKAKAEKLGAEKQAEENKAAILAAVEASGKSVEEILELLK